MNDASFELTCLARLEEELMSAAQRHPRARMRRFLGFFAALVIVVPVGYATARELISTPEPETHTINRKEVLEVAFLDPDTGQPILCPDGSLLTKTLEGVDVGGIPDPYDFAKCADGSVPEVYKRALLHDLNAAKHAQFGDDLSESETLHSFEVQPGDEDQYTP